MKNLIVTCLIVLSFTAKCWANEGKIIVDDAGVADKEVKIEITTTDENGKNQKKETIKFTPTATNVSSTENKAQLIADKITEQATTVSATRTGSTSTVTSDAGRKITKIRVVPGKSKEKDRVNPNTLASLCVPLQFELELTGSSTGDYLASVDISGPGGNLYELNTLGMSVSMILDSFADDISNDGFFNPVVSDNSLFIYNLTCENYFMAFFEDDGFDYSYSSQIIPEPTSFILLMMCIIRLIYRFKQS